jgi:tRNA G18 (ribose-2'-O)-methylase SpoU
MDRRIESLDDPRIEPYRNLKDRELAREGGRFIAEGTLLVRRLLASDYAVESVLATGRHAAHLAPLVPRGVPLYVASEEFLGRIVGYGFHMGALACGLRRPALTVDEVAGAWPADARVTLLVLPETTGPLNLGSLLRVAAAFGVAAVVLGEHSCDPFYRQSVRVSMGAVFRLNLVRSRDLAADLARLRDRWGVELAAAVLDEAAEPLHRARRPRRLAILFGNEAKGLAPEHLALAARRITIPMRLGTDSLNVAMAAAVFLYHFTCVAHE